MATSEAGHGNGGSGGRPLRLRDISDHPRSGIAPTVRATMPIRATYGGYSSEAPPCGKCGCEFLNVGCPKIWPIGTVVLTCAKCGSVVDYIDGLLIMTVTEAIQNIHGREWAIRRRMAVELSEARGIDEDVVMMALDQGMTMDEIVTALDMEMPDARL